MGTGTLTRPDSDSDLNSGVYDKDANERYRHTPTPSSIDGVSLADLEQLPSTEETLGDQGTNTNQLGSNSREIAKKEAASEPDDDTVGNGYRDTGKGNKKRRVTNFGKKKAAGLIGGFFGIGVFGGFLFMGPIALGPFEIMHASTALQHAFAKNDSDSSHGLVSEFDRYRRFRNTGNIGETRIGYLGSKIFGGAMTDLNNSGISFDLNKATGRPTVLTIDQEKLSENMEALKDLGIGSDEAKSVIADKLGGISADDIKTGTDGKMTVDLSGSEVKSLRLLTRNATKLASNKVDVSLLKSINGRILGAMRARVLAKYFDIPSLFHPFSRLRSATINKLAAALTKSKEQKGESEDKAKAEAQEEAANSENIDDFKQNVTEPTATNAKAEEDEIKSKQSDLVSKIGRGLTITGGACLIRDTAKVIAKANQDAVALPAEAATMRVIAAGSQVMSGTGGIDMTQVGALGRTFSDKNNQTIFQGKAFQSLADPTAVPTGPDLPSQYRGAFDDHGTAAAIASGADNILNKAGVGLGSTVALVCSPAGLLTQAALAVTLTVGSEIITGGFDTPAVGALWTANFIGQNVASMLVLGGIISLVEHTFINGQLPITAFEGPVGGNLMAFAARAAANTVSIAAGAVSLGNKTTTLPDNSKVDDAVTHPNLYANAYTRIFSLKNDDSLTSHLAASYLSSDMATGVSGTLSTLFHSVGSIFSIPLALLPHTSAETIKQYNWGFSQFGIPDDLLNDDAYSAEAVDTDMAGDPANNQTGELDGDNSQALIDRASMCWGVKIEKNSSDNQWHVAADHAVDTSSVDYTDANCTENSNWTSGAGTEHVDGKTFNKLLMFVFYSMNMNNLGCSALHDTQACNDANATNPEPADSASSGAPGVIVGASGPCSTPVVGAGLQRGGSTDTNDATKYPNGPLIPAACPVTDTGGVPIAAGGDIQAAVESHPEGTAFILAAGTWNGNQTVIVPKQGDKFWGAGASKTILKGIAIHSWGNGRNAVGNVEIHNMTFDGYDTGGAAGTAFGAVDSSDHGGGGSGQNWHVTNSEFKNGYIGMAGGKGSQVINNTFHEEKCKGGSDGVDSSLWAYNQFINNDLPGVSDPAIDCGGFKAQTNNSTIRNNLFSSNGPAGVKGESGYPGDALWFDFFGGNTIQDNIFYNNSGPAIEFEGTPAANNTVKGNIMANNAKTAYPGAIFIQGADSETITGNYIWGNKGGSVILNQRGSGTDGNGKPQPAMIPTGSTITGNYMDVAPSRSTSGNTISGNIMGIPTTVPSLVAGPQ